MSLGGKIDARSATFGGKIEACEPSVLKKKINSYEILKRKKGKKWKKSLVQQPCHSPHSHSVFQEHWSPNLVWYGCQTVWNPKSIKFWSIWEECGEWRVRILTVDVKQKGSVTFIIIILLSFIDKREEYFKSAAVKHKLILVIIMDNFVRGWIPIRGKFGLTESIMIIEYLKFTFWKRVSNIYEVIYHLPRFSWPKQELNLQICRYEYS